MPHPGVTAQDYPNRPAIIMGGSGAVVTYRQLEERSNQGAHLFRSLGLAPGDHICIMMENNRQFLEIVWAAQRSGLTFTPIRTHLDKHSALYIIDNCNARLFIGSREFGDTAERILCESRCVDHYFMVNGTRAGFRSWEEECAGQPVTRIEDESNGMPMLYAPGTNGRPQGISIEPGDRDVSTPPLPVPYLARVFDFTEETIFLCPAPLYYAAPLHFSMMTAYQGGTVVLMERFEPEWALKLIERHRVTHSLFLPVMFTLMLKLPAALRKSYDTASMRVAIHGGAACPHTVKEEMIDWWGEVLVEYYSSSEGIGMTLIDSYDWLSHRGSVGKALVGNIHIVDKEGRELPRGNTGTVYFSGDHIRATSHSDPATNADFYDNRGWARTQDIGYLDEDDFLYLADSEAFTIVSGGMTINPQELENILAAHEKVADVVVFGVPNKKFGEEIKAVVEPTNWSEANDETAEEILRWLRERVSWFKMPRSLEFHPDLANFDIGKIYGRQLSNDHRASAL